MKYVGSKAKLSKEIVPILQNIIDTYNIDTYIEPFVGGANIIDKIKCKNKYGFDIDNIPISIYKHFIKNEEELNLLPEIIDKELYYKIRDSNNCQDWYRSAVLLFGSYNSRVYGGCYGAMTKTITKDGYNRNYYKEAINNFRKQIPNLKNTKFKVMDYKNLEAKNCLIYCDPPYADSIGYSNNFNSSEFWQWVREMSKTNIVIVSEYKAPKDFVCIWKQKVIIHMNNRKKITKIEKLFTCNDVKSLNIVNQTSIFDNVKLLGDKK